MPKVGMQPIRRRQLIDATLEAINEVGMHDATIAQIARRAGVSTGIISHYFKDKNGLLEATMRDITGQLRDAVLNRLHALPHGSAEQRLQAIVGGNFDETQISGAAMKAWLAFWASSMHQPMLYRLQQAGFTDNYRALIVGTNIGGSRHSDCIHGKPDKFQIYCKRKQES